MSSRAALSGAVRLRVETKLLEPAAAFGENATNSVWSVQPGVEMLRGPQFCAANTLAVISAAATC